MSITQLSRLLPLPESELQQVLDHASSLSKAAAVDHFTNLLGDSPAVVDFISSFNSHRAEPAKSPAPEAASRPSPQPADSGAPPKPRGRKKKKSPLHALPARQIEHGLAPGAAYSKKDQQDDYISGRPGAASSSNSSTPAPRTGPFTPPAPAPQPAPRSSGPGTLVSELGLPKQKPKPKSTSASRSSTPGPATKVTIAGGTPMQGASTALADLDDAIRALEVATNPTHPANADVASRRCDCVAARHPLQSAAPNCLECGKVVCVKEGLGPCTFCGAALLAPSEVQDMIGELRAERGREKMAADREAHRKPKAAAVPGGAKSFFSSARNTTSGSDNDETAAAEARAREHRDRLLGFQAQNAQRTTVRDEAADFYTGGGGSMWASPEERARELKRQQKLLREMEWNARPDFEKRRQVVSIDLVGGKVVRRMAAVERPASPETEDDAEEGAEVASPKPRTGGAFSRNPLLGDVIKPVYNAKGKGTEGSQGERRDSKTKWRRVQDDLDDNEAVILDGGMYGGS